MDSKRKQILNIATQLFSEQGYDKTSISQIVSKAEVSKGLVYHHFKNKEELLREIIKETTGLMVEMNNELESSSSPAQKLVSLIEQIFHQLKYEKEFFQFNLNILFQPALKPLLHDLLKERSSHLFNSLNTIFHEKGSEDPELDTYVFISEIDGIVLDYLSVFEEYPLQKLKTHLIHKYGENP